MKADKNKRARSGFDSMANGSAEPRAGYRRKAVALAFSSAAAYAPLAHAFQFDMPDDWTARWDNTVKYSAAFRVKQADSALTADANQDDGDRNFHRGLISNRVDLLSELDLTYRNWGARVSAAAWYDSMYAGPNANNSPFTANATSVPYNHFTSATQTLNGRDLQLLDAFAFNKGTVGSMPYTVRLGQHSVLYGETLFFGNNGIAGAQSPVDINKLLGVPNTQFKELILPQPQISAQIQLPHNLTLGAYYQFSWQEDRLPPVGSYFSNVDLIGTGAERILAGPALVPGGGPAAFYRSSDLPGKNSGQGGAQLRWKPAGTEIEFGLYAAQFNAKDPEVYVRPGVNFNAQKGQIGTYQLVYPNAIRTIGASFSTSIGEAAIAGEVSFRNNMPLVSDPQTIAPGVIADNDDHPAYAVGNTLHANLSTIITVPRTSFWQGAFLLGEVAYNRRLSITANPSALDPNTTRGAAAIRVLFIPSYYQVLPGLDLSVPIGFGYTPFGRSSVISSFNGGSYHGGDLSIGVAGTYQQVWNFSLSYTHYLGAANIYQGPANQAAQAYTFGQSYADRDFIALSVSRTF